MIKLLRANLVRLVKGKIFIVCAVVMALYGLFICIAMHYSMHLNNMQIPFDNVFMNGYGFEGIIAIPGILMAVLCSVFIGTEFSDGTIRNKLIVGRTRTGIYLSNFVTCAVAGILLNIIYIIIVCIIGIPLFGLFQASASIMLRLILDGTLMVISYAAVFNLLSMLIQNKTTISIISIIGVMIIMIVSCYLILRLREPEYVDAIKIVDGEEVWTKIRNTRYLKETAKAICQFIIDLLPTGQSLQISGLTAPHLWLMAFFSTFITIAANITGVLFFKRKDLK